MVRFYVYRIRTPETAFILKAEDGVPPEMIQFQNKGFFGRLTYLCDDAF